MKKDPDGQKKAPKVIKEDIAAVDRPGYKFELPELPLPKNAHIKYRYDPLIEQVTNLLMRDGKKSVAQRVGALVVHR